jgi:hypothetical protein
LGDNIEKNGKGEAYTKYGVVKGIHRVLVGKLE